MSFARITGDRGLFAASRVYNLGPADNDFTGSSTGDVINGEGGDDTLRGGHGRDTIDGGDGNDVLDGGDNRDTLSFASASAHVVVDITLGTARGAGQDVFTSFNDLLGSAFDDRLTGNQGVNLIDGGAGQDTLVGGNGADVLVGGLGFDEMTGGVGVDTYLVRSITEVAYDPFNPLPGWHWDWIHFVHGDIIEVSAVDADQTIPATRPLFSRRDFRTRANSKWAVSRTTPPASAGRPTSTTPSSNPTGAAYPPTS